MGKWIVAVVVFPFALVLSLLGCVVALFETAGDYLSDTVSDGLDIVVGFFDKMEALFLNKKGPC